MYNYTGKEIDEFVDNDIVSILVYIFENGKLFSLNYVDILHNESFEANREIDTSNFQSRYSTNSKTYINYLPKNILNLEFNDIKKFIVNKLPSPPTVIDSNKNNKIKLYDKKSGIDIFYDVPKDRFIVNKKPKSFVIYKKDENNNPDFKYPEEKIELIDDKIIYINYENNELSCISRDFTYDYSLFLKSSKLHINTLSPTCIKYKENDCEEYKYFNIGYTNSHYIIDSIKIDNEAIRYKSKSNNSKISVFGPLIINSFDYRFIDKFGKYWFKDSVEFLDSDNNFIFERKIYLKNDTQ